MVKKSAANQFGEGEEYDISTTEFSFESASKTTEPYIEIHFERVLHQSQWYLGLDLGTVKVCLTDVYVPFWPSQLLTNYFCVLD